MTDSATVRINVSDIAERNKIDLRFQKLEIFVDTECKIMYPETNLSPRETRMRKYFLKWSKTLHKEEE